MFFTSSCASPHSEDDTLAAEAEFHWKPIEGYDFGTAFEGDVHIEGCADSNMHFGLVVDAHAGTHSPRWRFVQYRR